MIKKKKSLCLNEGQVLFVDGTTTNAYLTDDATFVRQRALPFDECTFVVGWLMYFLILQPLGSVRSDLP